MIPTSFKESNSVLSAPDNMPEVLPLSVFVNGTYVISCWKLTQEELNEVIKTGRIWLTVIGRTMPPVVVMGVSPFHGT